MIKYINGNIFDSQADAIINTVNCVGVAGKGLALSFRKLYPENFKAYKAACDRNEVKIGKMFVFETRQLVPPYYIINFPTKDHWMNKSELWYIEKGLDDLIRIINEKNIRSIAVPPLGAGLGGLKWEEVRALIEKKLQSLEVDITVYEPYNF